MLEPTTVEKIVANVEIREVFNITKVGSIAGCMVTSSKIILNYKVRIIRDGVEDTLEMLVRLDATKMM